VKTGVAMLVTGRNAESTWVELYIGVPGIQTGWAAVDNINVDTAIESLPVVHCVVAPASTLGPPETAGPSAAPTIEPSLAAPSIVATVAPSLGVPSAAPSATPRTSGRPSARPSVAPTVTPLPPPPPPPTIGPSPVPTQGPDLFPPSLSAPFITSPAPGPNGSYFLGHSPCAPPTATIRATASDEHGVAFVRLWYRPAGGSMTFVTMSYIGGNTYQATITPDNSWLDGEIGLWSQAQDTLGNLSSQFPFGNPNSSSDVSLFWSAFCIT
jgi:hypothetical protein